MNNQQLIAKLEKMEKKLDAMDRELVMQMKILNKAEKLSCSGNTKEAMRLINSTKGKTKSVQSQFNILAKEKKSIKA